MNLSDTDSTRQASETGTAIQRLAAGGPDVSFELERLRVAVHEIGVLAERSAIERGQGVTLAWLRRFTHVVERLEARWRDSMPPRRPAPQRRRDDVARSVAANLARDGASRDACLERH